MITNMNPNHIPPILNVNNFIPNSLYLIHKGSGINTLMFIVSIITIMVAVIDLMIGCYICTGPKRDNFDIALTIFTVFAGVVAMLMGIMGLTVAI